VVEERGEAWRTAAGLLRPGGLGAERGGKRVGRGCRLGQREEEREEGEVWAFGPISREREEEKNKYFSNFIFRPLLN